MRNKLAFFALAIAGGLLGANVQPILTGAGTLLFPENAVPATISASSGKLTIAAGGANQPIILNPSGTGGVGVNVTPAGSSLFHVGKDQDNLTTAQVTNANNTANARAALAISGGSTLTVIESFPAASTLVPAWAGGSVIEGNGPTHLGSFGAGSVYLEQGSAGAVRATITATGMSITPSGTSANPSYPLDVTGQINASTGFVAGGLVGGSGTKNLKNSSGVNCTLIFTNGILTGGSGC